MSLRFSRAHAAIASALLIMELFIAFRLNDAFVRPHLGDFLVVMLLHFAIRTVVAARIGRVALGVFTFAVLVELGQAMGAISWLGLERSLTAQLILGSTFQWLDLLMYALGAAAAA